MKYLQSMDHLMMAMVSHRKGNLTLAARHLAAASSHPSAKLTARTLGAIAAAGFKQAPSRARVSASGRLVRANPFDGMSDEGGLAAEDLGQEYRIEPELNGPRAVQSAEGDDLDEVFADSDETFTEDDVAFEGGETEFLEDDDSYTDEGDESEADEGEDEVLVEEAPGDDTEGEIETARMVARRVVASYDQARLTRVLTNLRAAAKKKAKKKASRK